MAKAKKVELVNLYKVPSKKWRNWPDLCQRVFNHVYGVMYENQTLFLHPDTKWVYKDQWQTTAWNAAWEAADGCQQSLKAIIKQKSQVEQFA
jgi:hypothetical protein